MSAFKMRFAILWPAIEFSPLAFQVFDPPDIRSAPFRKFSQSVIYLPVRGDVEVLAVFDGRRDLGSWKWHALRLVERMTARGVSGRC